jgi:hypothetical protein
MILNVVQILKAASLYTVPKRYPFLFLPSTLRLTEEHVTEADRDSLGLDVVVQRCLAELTANTRLLVTTEGKGPVESVVCVDPDGTSLERVGDLDGGVEVLSVHSGGETVCGVVANLDDIGLGLELGDGADGAEDLLLLDLHVLSDVGKDGGLNEVALVTLAVATSLNGSTRLLALLDVAHDTVKLKL